MHRFATIAGTLGLLATLVIPAAATPETMHPDSRPEQAPARAPEPPHEAAGPLTVRYTLRFPDPANHLVEIEAQIGAQIRAQVPAGEAGRDLELMMAVWTPGSYLVREFARNVEEVSAETADGRSVPVTKVSKNRWRVANGGAPVRVSYSLYCHELSVRTDFVEPGFALLNGAATYLVPAADHGPAPAAYEVRLEMPSAWPLALSSLESPSPGTFRAPDYDTLVDSPIFAGTGRVGTFEVDGVPHHLLEHGGEGIWDDAKALADVERIVQTERDFWGLIPYKRYLFMNLIVEAGGGLEHARSSVLMTSRWKAGTHKGYLDWLGLVAHELFHAWNVKRLRPAELGPFDYEAETYTRSLWVAEGITSYYDGLLVHRAGLSTSAEELEHLSRQIERLQTTPGRKVQPMELASFDAWIKLYRPDESTINTAVSYYTKGAVVAFLLDAEIRRATGGTKSLDDAMRLAWKRFPPERGFRREEMRRVFSEVAGRDLGEFLDRALDSTEELDYKPALEWLGLRFAAPEKDKTKEHEEPAGWLGADTKVEDGRLLITHVRRDTPAAAAGVDAEDEILALDGWRVPPQELDERLEAYRPDQKVTLLVARRGRLVKLPVTLGEKPPEQWKLEIDPKATEEQAAHRKDWLEGG